MRKSVISNLKQSNRDSDGSAVFFAPEIKALAAVIAEAICHNRYPMKGSLRLSTVRSGTGQIDTIMSCDLLNGACVIEGVDSELSGSSKKLTKTVVLETVRRSYSQNGTVEVPSGLVLTSGYAPVMVLQMGDGLLLGSFVAEYDVWENRKAEEVNVLTAIALAIRHMLGRVDQTVSDAVDKFLYSVWGGSGYRPDEMKCLIEDYFDSREELEIKQWAAWADGSACPRRGRLLFES